MRRIFLVFALSLLLQCHEKPASVLLRIPFNGTLKTSEGRLPVEDSGPHNFSSYRDHKMLTLRDRQYLRYDSQGWCNSKGALQLWIKLETLSYQSEIIRLMDEKGFSLQVVSHEKTVRIYFVDSSGKLHSQNSEKLFRPGTWMHLAIIWGRSLKEPISLVINGSLAAMSALTDGYQPKTKDKAGFYFGSVDNPPGFVISLREISVHSSIQTQDQVRSSFHAGLKEMQSPISWSAFSLSHFAGKNVTANGTRNVWTADSLFAYQDGIQLPGTSEYRFTFRIKSMTHLEKGLLHCEVWKTEQNKRIPIASWANKVGDLIELEKYKRISLKFQGKRGDSVGYAFYSLIPSKYSVFLDTIEIESMNGVWRDQRRAEDLEHTVGVWIQDAQAAKGKAWTNANTLLYGPYTCIGQPGRYRASWRMSIAPWAEEGLVTLDVYAHDGFLHNGKRGTRSYGKLAVSASDFSHRNSWENKSIEFKYDGANLLEFRAHAKEMNPGALFIDSVKVEWIGPR